MMTTIILPPNDIAPKIKNNLQIVFLCNAMRMCLRRVIGESGSQIHLYVDMIVHAFH